MKGTLVKGILEERLDTEWTGSSENETLVKRMYQTSPGAGETESYLVMDVGKEKHTVQYSEESLVSVVAQLNLK